MSSSSMTPPLGSSSLLIMPEAPPSPAGSVSKPSKKQTVDELKGGLEKLGLDTKGKKETLWR
jgi:hypothetical protein